MRVTLQSPPELFRSLRAQRPDGKEIPLVFGADTEEGWLDVHLTDEQGRVVRQGHWTNVPFDLVNAETGKVLASYRP